MRISRRQFIFYSVVGLSTYPIYVASNETKKYDWRSTCKSWMSVLLPSDKFGPGADIPMVWEKLEKLIKENSKTKQWFVVALNRLSAKKLPKSKRELEKMQRIGQPHSAAIRFLNKLFVEYYYASSSGWKEIGIEFPPQPKGFLP